MINTTFIFKRISCNLLWVLAILPALLSCKSSSQSSHNSENSLDWIGIYNGMLPCADCEGILTKIELRKDNTYSLTRQYMGKSDEVKSSNGSFSWDENGSKITLKGLDSKQEPSQYKVVENGLVQLDLSGNSIEGNLSGQYRLTKADNEIINKYWKLCRLAEKQVIPNDQWKREPHMILRVNDNIVSGNGGCNSFSGKYQLEGSNQIKFTAIAATRMFCNEIMEIENGFMSALNTATSFSVQGDSLYLMSPEHKTATFVNVYLR